MKRRKRLWRGRERERRPVRQRGTPRAARQEEGWGGRLGGDTTHPHQPPLSLSPSLSPPAHSQQTVQNEEFFCHAHNADGLVGIAFADAAYPARAAFGVVAKAIDDFTTQAGGSWRGATADTADAQAVCEAAVARYQDPAAADKLTAIQRDLDETKVVLHQTIESVLARGERLDALVDKSADLSLASQMFYKQARKTNSCCKMM